MESFIFDMHDITIMTQQKASELVDKLNSDAEDDWCYYQRNTSEGSAIVVINDENDNIIGFL